MTRVAVCQLAPRLGDLEHNAALAREAIRGALDDGAEVVVLPELVTSGYAFASTEEAREAAIAPDHPVLAEWAALAREADAVVVGGFCEAGEGGAVHNSAAVLDAGGLRAVYRKLHLWDGETQLFTAGTELPPVVETRVGRIGVVVCYDLEFPELTRAVALAGADLLAVPTNWPLVDRPEGERPPEVVVGMAAARVNRMAVACADRLGTERGVAWTGGSTVIGVDGWVAAETREVGIVQADLDLAAARDKRLTQYAHVMEDRRPELYGGLVQPG